MPQAVIGYDLSRAHVDTRDLPSGPIERIANRLDGIGAGLNTLSHDVRIVFETASDRELIATTAESG